MKNSLENVHLSIFNYLKSKAQSLEGKPSAQLLAYQKDQQKFANRKFSDSSIRELTDAIEHSDIIYLGDFHTFDQSTRNLERLIRILTSKRHDFVIALEFVHVKHQEYIDHFLDNNITELEFLESISYTESWRFPWTYYRRFFEIAKKEKIPIIALNTNGSLKSRDHQASKVIARSYKENPDRKILVLFGEYHIVPDKLPKKVLEITKKNIIHTIINQNLDEVYWKLSKDKKVINDKIVKFSKREYVLITSSPWLKYESQIYWYEHLSEDPDFDIHEYIIETGAINFSDNVPENFAFICDEVVKTLELDLQKDIEDFHLYDHIKLDYVRKEINKVTPVVLRNFYFDLITRGRSFKLPNSDRFFCPNYSINRISYLAGTHIFHKAQEQNKFDVYGTLLQKPNRPAILRFFIKQCTIAYFSSKLINPYRKCDLFLDYKKLIRSKKTKESKKKLYRIALQILGNKSIDKEMLKGLRLKDIYALARIIGHIFGDHLFAFCYSKGKGHEKIFKNIFRSDFSEENFEIIKEQILGNIKYKEMSKRMF